jgi:glycosyltransferase involved in cell wall biosynthesis
MRVCLISVEIFAWGKHGGFGKAARTIGRELAARGHEVCAVVPKRGGQRPEEMLDGIRVLGFSPRAPWSAKGLLRDVDADIYHSCEPSFATWLAMRARPRRKHLVTVRDPRDFNDWGTELLYPSYSRPQVVANWLYENNPLVRRSVRRADAVFAPARCLAPKIRAIYGLASDPPFLPTPVEVPATVRKAVTPTVCYAARLDRRKRPELFLDLASRFPGVRFVLMGKSRDAGYEAALRRRSEGLANLEWMGFVDLFGSGEHSRVLGESWVMVNCAAREGLPNAFLEAAAHGCAILGSVDPDGFASRFGYHAREDDFDKGLVWLLEGERWRALGEAGRAHVLETFELGRAVDAHEAVYGEALAR